MKVGILVTPAVGGGQLYLPPSFSPADITANQYLS
jgi:hypothetical protein